MHFRYAETEQNLETVFEDLQKYEEKESIHRLEDNFTESGDLLLQTENYNIIITPENIQVKGVDNMHTDLLNLEDGEQNAFEYLTGKYNQV